MRAFGWVILALLIIAALVVVGFLNNWGQKAIDVVSPKNVEKQYDLVIRDWEGLYASAENACLAGSPDAQDDGRGPTLVESPEQAYAATFRRIVAFYNEKQANLFKAKIVGPPGYPKEVPRSLGAGESEWCVEVPAALDALKAVS